LPAPGIPVRHTKNLFLALVFFLDTLFSPKHNHLNRFEQEPT